MVLGARQLVRELGKIVGRDNVLHHPEDLLVYEYDGSIDRSVPQVVVLPANTEEVSRVVAVGYRHGIPIVGRGSGTGLSGGAIAAMGGIQIALARMNRIIEVSREDRLATVQPAVINLNLDNRVRQSGMRYAPDPSSQRACSIGGNVAENAGGPHCLAYGVTTNHVLGLEVVLEDGSIVRLGSRTREAPGYDLRGAFVGSEGTFGIATTATVRLLPAPPAVKTFQGVFADVPSACNAVSAIIGRGIVPAAMEMVDALTIKAVQSVMDAGYPDDAGAVLLIEVEGTPDEVEELEAEVRPALRDARSTDVRAATDAADRERLWSGRKGALGALGSLAPNYYLVDGVVPRTQLALVLEKVEEVSKHYRFPIANVFHAGDGNLHPCILFDERRNGELERVTEAGGELLRICVEAGGTLSGEHGIGLEKKAYMPLVFSDDDMQTMIKVRQAFAPKGTFNPGKIFPGGPELTHNVQPHAVAMAGPGAYV